MKKRRRTFYRIEDAYCVKYWHDDQTEDDAQITTVMNFLGYLGRCAIQNFPVINMDGGKTNAKAS